MKTSLFLLMVLLLIYTALHCSTDKKEIRVTPETQKTEHALAPTYRARLLFLTGSNILIASFALAKIHWTALQEQHNYVQELEAYKDQRALFTDPKNESFVRLNAQYFGLTPREYIGLAWSKLNAEKNLELLDLVPFTILF